MTDYKHVFRNLRAEREMPRGAYQTREPRRLWNTIEAVIWFVAIVAALAWLLEMSV
jgi:hypothetical protein